MRKTKKNTTGPLGECVTRTLKRYFADLNGEQPTGIYGMVIGEIERPLLDLVMEHADQNQTRAAKMLGINRNTLRKKLEHYGID